MQQLARPEGIESLCQQIAAEPLHHLTLGSKELFHSNFLAWLLERFPNEMRPVLGPWSVEAPGAPAVPPEREWHRIDLLVRLEGFRPLLIENKVFAIPNQAQLSGYDEAIEKKLKVGDPSKALLVLTDPGWPADRGSWTVRTYADLVDDLERQVPALRHQDEFAGEIVARYVRYIRMLIDLVRVVGTPADDEPLLLGKADSARHLEGIRLLDGVQKARAQQAALELESKCRSLAGPTGDAITIASGFTRKDALVEAFVRQPEDGVELGWQYQRDQFRLVLRTLRSREERESLAGSDRYRRWFEFDRASGLAQLTEPHPPPKGWQFHNYSPDFTYRYVKAPALTKRQLIDIGMAYIDRARSWMPQIGPLR